MCSSHAARERNISSITHVRIVLRLDEVHEDAARFLEGVLAHRLQLRLSFVEPVEPRLDGDNQEQGFVLTILVAHEPFLPLADRHRTSSSPRNGNCDGILQRVDEGLRVLTLHERRHRVIERLLEGGWHKFAVRHR